MLKIKKMGFVDLLLKVIKKTDGHVVSECIMPSSNLEDMKVHIMGDFYSVEEKECIVAQETGDISLGDMSKTIKLE